MARKFAVRDDFEPLFYDELGRLVIAAGRVEYILKLCLKTLSGKDFTAGMLEAEEVRHLSSLCDKVSELAEQGLSDPDKAPFLHSVGRTKALAGARNDMIHALWTTTNARKPFRIRPELPRSNRHKSVNWSKSRVVQLDELCALRRKWEEAFQELQRHRNNWKLTLKKA